MDRINLWIGGKLVPGESGRRGPVYNPATGEQTHEVDFASVDEVANMVVYVCSPQASATTGAALRVDGGVVRSIA